MAANVASALKANKLILLTDVEGLLLDGKTINELHISEAKEIIDQVGAGMITKVYAAIEAVEGGGAEVVIASGFKEGAISLALDNKGGTVIKK